MRTDGFGALVRRHRKAAWLTQEELAERAGVSVRTVRNVEAGRVRHWRASTVQALASALGLTTEQLIASLPPQRGSPESLPRPDGPGTTSSWITNRQLPPDADHFVGRRTIVDDVAGALDTAAGVPVVVLSGAPGTGKTALAVRVAHRVAARFPDGQWFVDLEAAAPREPAVLLAELLYASGVPPFAIPDGLLAREAAMRSRLAGRRVLVLLDDAADAAQVRRLLPGSPGCAVLVTSRVDLRGLTALNGARSSAIGTLAPGEAQELVERVSRGAMTGQRAAELAALCGFLPLALRIAAANVAGLPGGLADRYLAELRHGDRIGRLAIEGDRQASIQWAFDASYARQEPAAQHLFRLLGLVPGPSFTAAAAAALAAIDVADAGRLLEQLAVANLVQRHASDRYRLHNLLALYAVERLAAEAGANAETGADTDAAARLYEYYVGSARDALRQSRLDSPEAGAEWFRAEHANLLAVVERAASSGPYDVAWRGAELVAQFYSGHNVMPGREAAVRAGMTAAEKAGDAEGRALMLCASAHLAYDRGMQAGAVRHARQAIHAAVAADLPALQAKACSVLAAAYAEAARFTDSEAWYWECLRLARQQGDRSSETVLLRNMAHLLATVGRLSEALDRIEEALEISRQIGSAAVGATCLGIAGSIWHYLGETGRARDALDGAAETGLLVSWPHEEARLQLALAQFNADTGQQAAGLAHVRRSISLARSVGCARIEVDALNVLGAISRELGSSLDAQRHHTEARRLAAKIGCQPALATAMIGLATVGSPPDRFDATLGHARDGLVIAERSGLRLHEGDALAALADIHLRRAELSRAIDFAERAVAVHRQTGYRRGEERTTRILAAACANGSRTPDRSRPAEAAEAAEAADAADAQPALGTTADV